MKKFDLVTIFPGMFESYFNESIIKRAKDGGFIEINVHNLRDYTIDKHKTVDDTPYGGGAGMVLKVKPIRDCLCAIKSQADLQQDKNLKVRTILFSAKGKRYTQEDARRLLTYDRLIMVCGRYEGVDERVANHIVDEELSIGDYVLTGGEIPAMVVVDSLTRLIPGVLGNSESFVIESHSKDGYLEYPQYTKPEDFEGWKVPEVLLSGNHAEIEKWRNSHSQKNKQIIN